MVVEFLAGLVVVLLVIVVYLLMTNLQWKFQFENRMKEWVETEEKRIREDAISRSSHVLSGKTLEKFVPFLEKFPYDPHDVRWLGDPIDLVVFDGYSSSGELKQVVFCEVKSGKSKLSKNQNKIKDVIENKKVRWLEFRP